MLTEQEKEAIEMMGRIIKCKDYGYITIVNFFKFVEKKPNNFPQKVEIQEVGTEADSYISGYLFYDTISNDWVEWESPLKLEFALANFEYYSKVEKGYTRYFLKTHDGELKDLHYQMFNKAKEEHER